MSAALRVLAPAIVALLGFVSPLAAVDGVIEINQAKALAGGLPPATPPVSRSPLAPPAATG
jgi:hypothetical protein